MKLLTYIFAIVSLVASVACAERVSGPDGKVYTYKEVGGVKRELELYFPEGHDPKRASVNC